MRAAAVFFCSLITFTCLLPVHAAELGTRDEAVAMVRRVQEKFKKDGAEATLRAINNAESEFLDRDLFPFVHKLDGTRLVATPGNPPMVGMNMHDMKDPDGKFFVREFVKVANTPPYHGWVDYRFLNSGAKLFEHKSTWIERLGDSYLVGVGIHESEQSSDKTVPADDTTVCKQATGDDAIAACSMLLALDRKNPEAYINRGVAYLHKGRYDRAIADFNEGIRVNPKDARAYVSRGAAHNDKGDYDRAIADFTQAIRLNTKYTDAYSDRGEAYEAKNDPDHAIVDFNQALKLDPALVNAQRGHDRVQAILAVRPNRGTQANGAASPVLAMAPTGRRIALVIGMSSYVNVPPLRNPASDARAVADALRRLGFAEVIEREDLTLAALAKTLKDFGDKAAEADWAVIYYAGHGVELNGENYLVPVDAKLDRADHVEDETVTLKRVLSKTEAAHKLRMVILDACRNSPFRMASVDGRSRTTGRGLSPVEPSGGVLVAYAARGGTVADDGSGDHSPFTQALLANLEMPNLDIRIMFSKVRDQVLVRTSNAQEPFTYGSLPGEELYFKQPGAR